MLGQQRSSFFCKIMERNSNTDWRSSVAGIKAKLKPLRRGYNFLQLTCNAFKCLFGLIRVVLDLFACEVGATFPVNEPFNI